MNDHQGSTWEEIVGAANVSDKRIGVGRRRRDQGCKGGVGCRYDPHDPTGWAEMVPDGTQVTTGIMYKGIPGTVFCAGSDCAVEAVCPTTTDMDVVVMGVKKLTGSWYFTPDTATSGTSGPRLLALRRIRRKPCTPSSATGWLRAV